LITSNSTPDFSPLGALEARLGYTFRDRSLLETALTHPSYGGDYHTEHYQRLEFLGDAVLELAVSRYLYLERPRLSEGQLSRLRSSLVREEALCEVARGFDLGALVRLSVGEERGGGRDKPSILADVMEAVIAAVYLDGGADEAFLLVRRALGERLDDDDPDALDAKTRLQEVLQAGGGEAPVYELTGVDGPPHLPVFHMRVMLGDRELGRGSGSSKRQAQQYAARAALKKLPKDGAGASGRAGYGPREGV
jgi:ribonuclease-3